MYRVKEGHTRTSKIYYTKIPKWLMDAKDYPAIPTCKPMHTRKPWSNPWEWMAVITPWGDVYIV